MATNPKTERFKPLAKAVREAILADLTDGRGIRETARRNKVSATTVMRVRKQAAPPTAIPGEGMVEMAARIAEMERDLTYSNARNERLSAELAQSRAERETEGVAGESVAGRIALAQFRRETWENLAEAVVRLPQSVIEMGWDRIKTMVSAELLPDLHTLMLGRPRSTQEATYRTYLEHFLTDPSKLAVMVRPTPEGGAMRRLFLELASKYIYAPAVSKLFERSIETPPFPDYSMMQG